MIEAGVFQEMDYWAGGEWRWTRSTGTVLKTQYLLRPHGRNEGRVWRWGGMWMPGGFTRANAAQAVWDAHKKAEAEIRSMMPSVSYSWTEDAE